jgi:hypothetical protein
MEQTAQPEQIEHVPEHATTSFQWNDIAADDNKQFVSNLHSVDCPECTIIDILTERLQVAYASSFLRIARSHIFASSTVQMQNRNREYQMLEQDIEHALYDELGLQRQPRSAGLLFNAEEERRITEAQVLFPKLVSTDLTNSQSSQQARSNRLERIQYLTGYLSKPKLLYYKLDREGDAPRVQIFLRDFYPTEQEFLAVAEVLNGKDYTIVNGTFDPSLSAALQTALTVDRFAFLQALQQPEIRAIAKFGQANHITKDNIALLIKLRPSLTPANKSDYAKRVLAVLIEPELTLRYLDNRNIHPNITWTDGPD